MPDEEDLVPVCYRYWAMSHDGMKRALYNRAVVRTGTITCRSCKAKLRERPQLWAQRHNRSKLEQSTSEECVKDLECSGRD